MGIKAWSNEEELALQKIYLEETKDIQEICDIFRKGHRSIISKLVNMGIYEKPENVKSTNRAVKTMLRDIESILDIKIQGLNLNKKSNLLMLVESLEKYRDEINELKHSINQLEEKIKNL